MTKQPYRKRAKNPDTPEVTQRYYLNNSKLLPEVLKSKEKGKMSDDLALMLMMLTRKYASRPCFNGYSYKDDMISEALANLCQNALKFDPERSSNPNPFAFYTSCINNSFLQFLNVEKKHRRIRDRLLVEIGESPSFNFTDEQKSQSEGGEYTHELTELRSQIEDAKIRMAQEAINKMAAEAEAAAAALAEASSVPENEVPTDENGVLMPSLLLFDDVQQTIDAETTEA